MAKSIEELKETINNTITQNGAGQITGQGLNLVLNDMTDTLSTTGGGGGGGVYVCLADSILNIDQELVGTTTPENMEINKKAYAAIKAGLESKTPVSIYVSAYEMMQLMGATNEMTSCGCYVVEIMSGIADAETIADFELMLGTSLQHLVGTTIYMMCGVSYLQNGGEPIMGMLAEDGRTAVLSGI